MASSNYAAELIKLAEANTDADCTFTSSTDLVEDAGLSSIEIMELIEVVEDHFDISLPLNNLEDLRTLADIAEKIQQLKI